MDFFKEAETLAHNKWVWMGAGGVVLLVAGYMFVSAQQAQAASAGGGASVTYPSTLDPLSAIGSPSGGGGSSGSSPTIDPTALLGLETTISNNNLQLGLAQIGAQTTANQLNAQLGLAGIQAQTTTSVAQSVLSALTSMFGKKSGNYENFDGAFNIGGTPISFDIHNNVGSKSPGESVISQQIGNDQYATGYSPAVAASGSASGAVVGSVASVGAPIGGASSVVIGSNGYRAVSA